MSLTVRLPALSANMEKATIVKWLKRVGDRIAVGDVLAEVETDKATMEMEAMDAGVLAEIIVPGRTADVPVNELIAVLTVERAEPTEAASPSPPPAVSAAPARVAPTTVEDSRGRVAAASPLARRLAREQDVDIASMTGSGPQGRIVAVDVRAKADQLAAAARQQVPEAPRFASPAAKNRIEPRRSDASAFARESYIEIPVDRMRKTIAANLSLSKQTIPHFYVTADIELDAALELRAWINERATTFRLSINDFVVKAVAMALEQTPEANSVWADDRILHFKRCDVAVAIAVDNGIYAPVVRDVASKTLSALSREIDALADKARSGALAPPDYRGGATAVSNLGMYGVQAFGAIINPPQSSIFAIGAAKPRAVVKDGAIVAATCATVTLSCDHRVIDGVIAARTLDCFKALLEDPLLLLA